MVYEICEKILASKVGEGVGDAVGAGILGFVIGLGLFIAFLMFVAVYVYTSLAWYAIAKKLKYKKVWFAWIPIVRWAMVLHLGGFGWGWVFLILIPIFGWIALLVLFIISTWRIFEKRKYPGWFSLSVIVPKVGFVLYLVAIGVVAWAKPNKR